MKPSKRKEGESMRLNLKSLLRNFGKAILFPLALVWFALVAVGIEEGWPRFCYWYKDLIEEYWRNQ